MPCLNKFKFLPRCLNIWMVKVLEKLVQVRKTHMCRVCGRIIPRGEPALSSPSQYGFRYTCLACSKRLEENEILVYAPADGWGERSRKRLEK